MYSVHNVSILVVEDEPKYRRLIVTNLKLAGYNVQEAENGHVALQLLHDHEPDLVLLDLRLPELDGFEVCQRIRRLSPLPIIVLTALNTEMDIIRALDMGADDYVIKPFSSEELMARIRALLRRSHASLVSADEPLTCGQITLKMEERAIVHGDKRTRLTPTEWRLMREFVINCGKVLTHEHLLGRVWGPGFQQDNEYLRVYVRRLRSYIEPDSRRPVYLITHAGIGYVLHPSEHGTEQ